MDLYLDRNHLSYEKNWTPMPSTSGSYGRQEAGGRMAGWQTKYDWISKS